MESTTIERPDTQLFTWSEPSPGLWIVSTVAAHIGMVDRRRGGFMASGSSGERLGVFADPRAAKLAVIVAWRTGSGVGATRGVQAVDPGWAMAAA